MPAAPGSVSETGILRPPPRASESERLGVGRAVSPASRWLPALVRLTARSESPGPQPQRYPGISWEDQQGKRLGPRRASGCGRDAECQKLPR